MREWSAVARGVDPFRDQAKVEPWDGASVADAELARFHGIDVPELEAITLIVVITSGQVAASTKPSSKFVSSLSDKHKIVEDLR